MNFLQKGFLGWVFSFFFLFCAYFCQMAGTDFSWSSANAAAALPATFLPYSPYWHLFPVANEYASPSSSCFGRKSFGSVYFLFKQNDYLCFYLKSQIPL